MGKITSTYGATSSGTTIVPPGDVTAILAQGVIDPQTGQIAMLVTVTPPATLGTFVGCEIYLEVPDQSATAPNIVGVAPVGTVPVGGKFSPIDCAKLPYVAAQQPWQFSVQAPGTINWTVSTPCRVYCVSYSNNAVNTLVAANQTGASPSQTFGLTPIAEASPTSATNSTAAATLLTNFITCENLGNFNVSGKLETAFEVLVNSVPSIQNYVYRLVATPANSDATNPKNQAIISGALTQPGFVQSGGSDGIPIVHSFSMATPTTTQNWVLWMQSGTVKNGQYTWNNIVPGITPSFPFTLTSSGNGTIDASQVLLSSIESYFSVNGPLLGINVDGITIQNTGGQFALVADGIDAGVYIKDGTILSAKIANAQIVDAQIVNLSAAKITFGTLTGIAITAVTVTSSSMSAIAMTASTLTVTANGITTTLSNANGPSGSAAGLTVANSSFTLELNPAAMTVWESGTALAQLNINSGAHSAGQLNLNTTGVGATPAIFIGGVQVLGPRQTGVGSPPSFSSFSGVQTYLDALYGACVNLGFLV